MNTTTAWRDAAVVLVCSAAVCAASAQTAAAPADVSAPTSAVPAVPTVPAVPAVAAPTPAPAQPVTDRGEPAVQYTVIEDEGSRIDELRVRGQTQRITVTPKAGGKNMRPYEIISSAGSQSLLEAPNGVRGAAGKRVWHVLSF